MSYALPGGITDLSSQDEVLGALNDSGYEYKDSSTSVYHYSINETDLHISISDGSDSSSYGVRCDIMR